MAHWRRLVGSWLLLLCCHSAPLLKPSARFFPVRQSQPVRAEADFTCSISNANVSDNNPHWYKLGMDGQPGLLDTRSENKKYRITRLDPQAFNMRILKLEKSDSGRYFCAFVSFSLNQPLTESNRGNLTVTEIAPESGSSEDEKGEEDGGGHNSNGKTEENTGHKIPLAAIGGCGLLLVLVVASLCFFLIRVIWRRQEQGKCHDENIPLEAEPPAVAVFTVDYGVLEFQTRQNARRPPLPPPSPRRLPSEQTEYATIIFPAEKPAPADTDKRTKKQGRCAATRRAQPR